MHCVNAVKSSVRALNGISNVDVDLASKRVTVDYDSTKVDVQNIKHKIEDAGYSVV
jgi:copper chaperone